MQGVLKQTTTMLEMIKFQHTVFALPFAVASMLIAAHGLPPARIIIGILLCCVFARTAAMSFNRWADRLLDARNPRTSTRAIPAGQLSAPFVLIFALASALAFVITTAFINPLVFILSPVALIILFGYSYTKRFTSLAHFVLGIALALAPVGAGIAVTGKLELPALCLGFGVLFWTAGFDLIYACQDVEVDSREKLHSIPSRLGVARSLQLSRILHVLTIVLFSAAGYTAGLTLPYYAGVFTAAILLIAMHWVVDPHDIRRINLAFFTINSWVGMVIMAGTIISIITR